ncbi:MAG: DNA-directed RNA polymerase subunit K [Candidatus Nanoarchaeia archaeon]|nr:DNA-directed RNA polymerase subunit K [Candidatus Nanoarchaeia archaeon]MDD5741243.1 DNA-directed RNA polymerase subunit K [Candidatus Nanoarchaeia archaeon]
MIEKFKDRFTRYEIARILGARSLQLAMDAPMLLKLSKEEEEALNYDSLKIAEKEFDSEVLPITVRRPMPKRSEKSVKKLSEDEIKEKIEKKIEEEQLKAKKEGGEKVEEADEKEIQEEGEIMEMAKPEDESEEEGVEGEEEG